MSDINFKRGSNGHCKASSQSPDSKAIQMAIAMSKKEHKGKNTVIIGRFAWLQRHKLFIPSDMTYPNICVIIKEGKLDRAFYSNVLTHVIKKQNYHIQIFN